MGYFDKTIEFIEDTPIDELMKKMKEYGVKFVENPNYKGDKNMHCDHLRYCAVSDTFDLFKKGDRTINQLEDKIKEIVKRVDFDIKNMDKDERIQKLNELKFILKQKYEQKHEGTHNVFIVDQDGLIFIMNNYKDVLMTSDLYISCYGVSQTMRGLKDIYCSKNWLSIDWDYEKCESGSYKTRLNEIEKFEVNISCEIILSFDFYQGDKYTKLSFRELGK
jgi:hypothetical protein